MIYNQLSKQVVSYSRNRLIIILYKSFNYYARLLPYISIISGKKHHDNAQVF